MVETILIQTRATPDEVRLVDRAAEKQNRSRANFLITTALEKAKEELGEKDATQ